MTKEKKETLGYLLLVACAMIATWYISTYHFQLMLIQGESMWPTYHSGAFVIIDKHRTVYKTGQIIAFKCEKLDSVLVKRVVAMPGDIVGIDKGVLLVNGVECEYFRGCHFDYVGVLENNVFLGCDEYFVIGDNISESIDSRYEEVGIIRDTDIIGGIIDFQEKSLFHENE